MTDQQKFHPFVLVTVDGGVADSYCNDANVTVLHIDYDNAEESDEGASYTAELIEAVEGLIERYGPDQALIEALGSLRDIAEQHENAGVNLAVDDDA